MTSTRGASSFRAFSVERGVGPSKQVFSRVGWLQFRDPNGHRRGLGSRGERDVDKVEALCRFGAIETCDDTGELVTAIANDQVMGAQLCPERMGHIEQSPVTSPVAARIVDRLEAININERHGERLLGTSRPRYLAFELHRPWASKIRTRQAIVRGPLSFLR